MVLTRQSLWVMTPRTFFLLEFCPNGDLFDVLSKMETGFTDTELLKNLFRQMCAGTKALHELGLANYDIKVDNVLVSADMKLKICDLGLAQKID